MTPASGNRCYVTSLSALRNADPTQADISEALASLVEGAHGLGAVPVALGMAAPSKWAPLIWPISAYVGMAVAVGILRGMSPAFIGETIKPALLGVVALGCIGHWVLRPALNWVRLRLAR